MATITGEEAEALDLIEEISETQDMEESKRTSRSPIEAEAVLSEEISGIQGAKEPSRKTAPATEGETDDDVCDQIVYMIENMSARLKRRTLGQLQPLLSSTVIEATPSTGTESMKQDTLEKSIIVKSRGNPIHPKLRIFSGIAPTPTGHVSFPTWLRAATRLSKTAELDDEEKMALIHNSLSHPALDLAQTALDTGSPQAVLKLLEKAYGNVQDPRDLLNEFNATTMNGKESASEYLNRLHLKLEELKDKSVVTVSEGPTVLLRQFNYGCIDENIILRLRLEEKESNPPDYGSLLLALRKEEAKRTKRSLVQKHARSQGITQRSDEDEVSKLRREVEALKLQLDKSKSAASQAKNTAISTEPSPAPTASGTDQPRGTRRRLRFCFKCGEEGHVVWKCRNSPNPQLVCQKFEEQEN